MRKFNITVNGVSYEVEVEEMVDGMSAASVPSAAPVVSTLTPVTKPVAPTPGPVAKPAPTVAAPTGATTIEAPMPGNIWKVGVEEGQEVKAGDMLVILEAMKMENEIMAPVDGVVASVHVAKGAAVNGGDVLVSLK